MKKAKSKAAIKESAKPTKGVPSPHLKMDIYKREDAPPFNNPGYFVSGKSLEQVGGASGMVAASGLVGAGTGRIPPEIMTGPAFTIVDDHDELVGRPSSESTQPIVRADPPAVDENNHPTYDVPITDKTHAVHHIDGNPSNNDLSNLAVIPVAENLIFGGGRNAGKTNALYRKVPGTNVSRADAVAYARNNWPFGAMGRPVTAGFEWMQDSMRHVMSWETFAQEATK